MFNTGNNCHITLRDSPYRDVREIPGKVMRREIYTDEGRKADDRDDSDAGKFVNKELINSTIPRRFSQRIDLQATEHKHTRKCNFLWTISVKTPDERYRH